MEMSGEKLTTYAFVANSAMTGFLQGIHDEVTVTRTPGHLEGVHVFGDGGMVNFEDVDGTWFLRVVCFAKDYPDDGVMAHPVEPDLASDLLANLTVAEIADWIFRANKGEDPKLTDYVEEVI